MGALVLVIMLLFFVFARLPSQRALAIANIKGAPLWIEAFRNNVCTLVKHNNDHGWHNDAKNNCRFYPLEEEIYYLDGKIPILQGYEENAKAILGSRKLAIISTAMTQRNVDTLDDLEDSLNNEVVAYAEANKSMIKKKQVIVQTMQGTGASDEEITEALDKEGLLNNNHQFDISGTIRIKSILTSLRSDCNPRAVSQYGRQREQIGKFGEEKSDNTKKIMVIAICGFMMVLAAVVGAPFISQGLNSGGGGQQQQSQPQGNPLGLPSLDSFMPKIPQQNPGGSSIGG